MDTGPSARKAMMPDPPPAEGARTRAGEGESPQRSPSDTKTGSESRSAPPSLPPGPWSFSVVFVTATNVVFAKSFTTELTAEEA